jgi:hypothetical protein
LNTRNSQALYLQIAIGWVAMLVVLTLTIGIMISESIYQDNNFKAMKEDPGPQMLRVLFFLFWIYTLMPIVVCVAENSTRRFWRWAAVVVAGLFFFFFFLHHMGHWYWGDRPSFATHVPDLMHHGLAAWVFLTSLKWARQPAP